jgi:hypothetical protein
VTIRQALFIAPCSHTFHYKCIRPLLDSHHPAFSCPLCRTFADLEEDVEVDTELFPEGAEEAEVSGSGSNEEGDGDDGITPAVPMPPNSMPSPDNEREREAGAETEVENEGGVRTVRHTRNRTSLVPAMHTVVDLMEDDDRNEGTPGELGESSAGAAVGTLIADSAIPRTLGGDMDVDEVGRITSPVNGLEGESSDSGSGMGSPVVIMPAEMSSGEMVNAIREGNAAESEVEEGMIGGKRKR